MSLYHDIRLQLSGKWNYAGSALCRVGGENKLVDAKVIARYRSPTFYRTLGTIDSTSEWLAELPVLARDRVSSHAACHGSSRCSESVLTTKLITPDGESLPDWSCESKTKRRFQSVGMRLCSPCRPCRPCRSSPYISLVIRRDRTPLSMVANGQTVLHPDNALTASTLLNIWP